MQMKWVKKLLKSIFFNDSTEPNEIIASFYPEELINFIHYYSDWLIKNIEKLNNNIN